MGRIILVSGGSRSGKSAYAQSRAESQDGSRLFIATCPRIDSELNNRIDKHIIDREGKGWKTIEEEHDLAGVIRDSGDFSVIVVDCLTLWINNLLYQNKIMANFSGEDEIIARCKQIIKAAKNYRGTIIFVTNEVGSGIVPESAQTRLYRDFVGRCNQCIAGDADEVIFVTCGIPLVVKSI